MSMTAPPAVRDRVFVGKHSRAVPSLVVERGCTRHCENYTRRFRRRDTVATQG